MRFRFLILLASFSLFSQNKAVHDTTFVPLQAYTNEILVDLKYATNQNFLKTKVYDCPECYLRYKTLKALIAANQEFLKKGYRIKLFDCYRPLDVQKKMWKLVPGTNYVANPKKGSIHNKGAAVDLTLVDSNGKPLDMGTPFDFFGPQAHHNYPKASTTVQKNRRLLQNTLAKYGFTCIRSEWWHYNYTPMRNTKVANFKWTCP